MEYKRIRKIFWYHHSIADKILYKSTSTLWSWIQGVKNFFDSHHPGTIHSDQAFMKYYLTSSLSMNIQFLVVNIILLLAEIYVIAQKHFGDFHVELDPTFDYYQVAIVEIVIWIVLSSLCLGFQLILLFKPSLFKTFLLSNECDIWYEIGATVMITRILIFVMQIMNMFTSSEKCIDAADLIGTGDHAFAYIFIKLALDTYQTYAFVILPFPQPWAVFFSLIEMMRQELRLWSCSDRISTEDSNEWIAQLIGLLILMVYITLMLFPSIFLEISVRKRYQSILSQKEAEKSKNDMVKFLSNDVRVPLQYMLHVTTIIDFIDISGGNVKPLLNDITKYSSIVNDIADDLLLLVRINENRYTSKYTRVENLCFLIDTMIQNILDHNNNNDILSINNKPKQCSIFTIIPSIPCNIDEKCLLAILRHILVFLTQEKLNDQNENTCLDIFHRTSTQLLYSSQDIDNTEERLVMKLTANIENVIGFFGQNIRVQKASIRSPAGAIQHTSSEEFVQAQVLKITLSGESRFKKTWSERRRVHEATTAYICHSIASSCGGEFTVSKNAYTLTLPCRTIPLASTSTTSATSSRYPATATAGTPHAVTHVDHMTEEDINPQDPVANLSSRVNPNLPDTSYNPIPNAEQSILEQKLRESREMQTRFRKNRVCAIVEDPVLGNVITGAIQQLQLEEGMSVLHELPRGEYVPVAALTFVTSYALCTELRGRKYAGRIVLFSGSVSYLDDEQVASVDYCLPLPCNDQHLCDFIDWLVRIHKAEKRQIESQKLVDRAGNTLSVLTKSIQRTSKDHSNNSTIITILYIFNQCIKYIYTICMWFYSLLYNNETWLFVTRLPSGSMETYCWWRILNPSQSWFHHSVEVWVNVFPRTMLAIMLEIVYFEQPWFGVAFGGGNMVLLLLRPYIFIFLLYPLRIRMFDLWLLITIISLFLFTYYIYEGSLQPKPTERNLSLNEFIVHSFYAMRTGAGYIYSQMMTAAFSRMYSMHAIYPLSIVNSILIFIRSSQICWLVIRTMASAQMTLLVQLIYVQMLILNFIYFAQMENIYRIEFNTAYQHILTKAFLEQCLDICQQDIRKPLQYLLERQKDLMKVLVLAAYSRNLVIDRTLLSKLEPLHVCGGLFTEIIGELFYSSHPLLLSDKETSVSARTSKENVQLSRAVSKIISSFSSAAEDHHVKIFAEIDTSLAVIQVDWAMLGVILTNLVATALRNIRDYCIEQPRNKDLTNYILLKFVAIESTEKVPFVAPRLMLINVCDSSNAAQKAAQMTTRLKEREDSPEYFTWTGATASREGSNRERVGNRGSREWERERDGSVSSQYGQSVCERLVRRVSPRPIFETIAVQTELSTVQRFTFPYHLTPQTHRAQEFIEAETDIGHLTVGVRISTYLSSYQRLILSSPLQHNHTVKAGLNKQLVYLSGQTTAQRSEMTRFIKRFEAFGWKCSVKYILSLPSMHAIAGSDCILLDQQLEYLSNVNISDTVLKLRCCGYNGVISVLLAADVESSRVGEAIRDEVHRGTAEVDLILNTPLRDQHIQQLTVAVERKAIRQLLYMNGNSNQ